MTKPKLAVIDDDQDVQDLLVGFFRPKGYDLVTFDDAEEALKAISSSPDFCNVILSDLRLPHMSGVELTGALQEKGITTPIIIMTAHRSAEVALEAIEAGAYDFVVKPLHFPQLQVSVERALHFNKMREENQALRAVVTGGESVLQGIIGKSPKFLRALDLARRVANSTAHVLVTGESGTGKEVVAKAIHQFGTRRSKGPFTAINCSAIPENLLEAELFGYAKGAFTGAVEKRIGLFEEATGGTLFLDEIGDLSLPLQAKLLRVLQDKKIKRLGENQTRTVDVRVVSATHKNLRQEVLEGRFREDLFFRLNVIPINLPPLRERKEDIVPLSEFFLKKHAALNRTNVKGFAKAATEYLLKNHWKGNVRELENVVERAVVLTKGTQIDLPDLNFEEDYMDDRRPSVEIMMGDQPRFVISEEKILPLDELINKYIVFALGLNQGAKDRTAKDLGVDRKTLYRRVREMEQSGTLPQ